MSSGCVVEIGENVILLDHGPGSHHRMLEAGISPTDITHLFFTHLHYDHCLDYARLVLTRWDQGHGEIPKLKVYGPPYTTRMTEALFGSEGAFAKDIEARIKHPASVQTYEMRGGVPPRLPPAPEVTEIESGQVIEGNDWRIRAVAVSHVQPYLACYGYIVQSKEGSLAYSGDAGRSDGFIQLAEGCDVMIHMCHQISGTEPGPEWLRGAAGHMEVAEIGRDAKVRNLVLTHIPDQMDAPGIRERLIREMGRVFTGNIFWGEDLMEIPVGDPMPKRHTG
jgi:ribonuclease BN (tRNA processing enzyme)